MVSEGDGTVAPRLRGKAVMKRKMPWVLTIAGIAALALWAPNPAAAADPPALWPEVERLFFLDGPAWLLPESERTALLAMAPAARGELIATILSAETMSGVTAGELATAIERRRRLMRSEFMSPEDVRARLLFLHGAPAERLVVDCGETFVPLEIWRFPGPGGRLESIVVYRPGPGQPWRLWIPYDGKEPLYTTQMAYFLEQWEENNGRLFTAPRFDLQACREARQVDLATGINALHVYRRGRPTAERFLRFLEPPVDIEAWVRSANATALPDPGPALEAGPLMIQFPEFQGQRLVTRFAVAVPNAGELPTAPKADGEGEELRLVIEGLIEEGSAVLDEFRVRFVMPEIEEKRPAMLVFDEPLRPSQEYVVRMRVTDEVGGGTAYLTTGFRVPAEPDPEIEAPAVPDEAIVALAQEMALQPIAGADNLVLVPPVADVVLNLWRAEAIVSGTRIAKVAFAVDGETQVTDNKLPYSAELRLARFPTEQVITAVGYDAAGEVVMADEVIINQPRGALAVRITDPPTGVKLTGDVEVGAQVVVPEGRRVTEVTYQVDAEVVARLERPPWRARFTVPKGTEFSYLSVTATLDNGASAEDVRILNAPDFVEDVEVDLIEIFAAVTDRSGHPVEGLTAEDFTVLVDGKPVDITRFEPVKNLPLTVGITVDSSGSMASSLTEAQKAAREFLTQVIGLRDHAFAVGFANYPVLLMTPTTDADAVADALGKLRSVGATALHDAVMTTLYYFRGYPGQRAMILLSDGDDTSSGYAFRDVLEYARRSGVSIYSVGLSVKLLSGARGKLEELAAATGGRSFFIGQAEELAGVYKEIEDELRSRYLIGVYPGPRQGEGFRQVEVRVRDRGLRVRTPGSVYQ